MGISLKGLIGGSKGPSNPFSAPDLRYLLNPTAFSYLKDQSVDPTGGFKNYYDFYRPPVDKEEAYFGDALGAYNAPSSVDAVRSEVNNARTQGLIDQINRDTNQGVAQAARGYYDRGLIQPGAGVSSDIAAIGLQNAANEGARRAADVRSTANLADVERLAQRESDLRNLYSSRYGAGVNADTQGRALAAQAAAGNQGNYLDLLKLGTQLTNQNRNSYADILNNRDLAYATGQAGLYNAAAQRELQGTQPGFLQNFFGSYANSLGQSAGGGGGFSKYASMLF
jgi:hypothetical protein